MNNLKAAHHKLYRALESGPLERVYQGFFYLYLFIARSYVIKVVHLNNVLLLANLLFVRATCSLALKTHQTLYLACEATH